jgi:hypothetical protein
MVLEISGQTKKDAQDPHSHFFRTIYVEADFRPDIKTAANKLKAFYGEEFDEKTVSIHELRDWDAEAMRKGGMPVFKI